MFEQIKAHKLFNTFDLRFLYKAVDKLESDELPDAERAIYEQYLSLWKEIYDSIFKVGVTVSKCEHIIEMGYLDIAVPSKGSEVYIEFQLGKAMVICCSGLELALNGEMKNAMIHLCLAHSIFAPTDDDYIKSLLLEVAKYKSGPKHKSKYTQEKWNRAMVYFLEEIPKHRTLKKARQIAAERAGICVEERQLALKLPNPKKKIS